MSTCVLALPDELHLSEQEVQTLLADKLVEIGRISPEAARNWQQAARPKDAVEIQRLVALYYAAKATAAVDALWDEKGWTADTMQEWLNEHMRTPYRPDPAA